MTPKKNKTHTCTAVSVTGVPCTREAGHVGCHLGPAVVTGPTTVTSCGVTVTPTVSQAFGLGCKMGVR